MPRPPLTRDQRTARAFGLFLGVATAVILYLWIVRDLTVNVQFYEDYSALTEEQQRSGGRSLIWWSELSSQSPCEIYYEVHVNFDWLKAREWKFGHHRAVYGDLEKEKRTARNVCFIVLGIVLLLVFRVVMLIVRLTFPCGDVEEESETEA
jgi:hypothetical protein